MRPAVLLAALLLAACAGVSELPAELTGTWLSDRLATASTRLVDSLELRSDGTGKWSRDLYYRDRRSPEGSPWVDTAHRQFPPMALRWRVKADGAERGLCTYNVAQEDSTCAALTLRPTGSLTVGEMKYQRAR